MTKQQHHIEECKEAKHAKRSAEIEAKLNEPNKLYRELLQLKQLVISTRLNRINAANRLQRTETFLQGINIYYSCFAAVLSVLSLISDSKALAVWSVLLTVILAISVVYFNAQKYGNRAQELKTNYIALQSLLFEIEEDEANNTAENFKIHYTKYCELLQTSENHINLDNIRRVKRNNNLSRSQWIEYSLTMIFRWSVKIILSIFPIIITLWLGITGAFKGILY